MKILWIFTACGLEDKVITGGPIRFNAILNRWKNIKEIEQIILTTSGGKGLLTGMGGLDGFEIKTLPSSLFLKKEPFKSFKLYSYFITSIAAKFKYKSLPRADIIITVSDYFCDIVPALLLKKKNPDTKWIAWIHHRETHPKERPGNYIVNKMMYSLQIWSLKKIAKYADEAWTYITDAGDSVQEELQKNGMNNNQIYRMKCGMELKDVPKENVTKTVDAVMIGVRPNKGMFDIIPVWEQVNKKRRGTTLRLMGGMVDTTLLEEEIKNKGLENNIIFYKNKDGFTDTTSWYKLIKESHIMFAPSREEGWGIAVCEAMACGLPVVGYDLPTYRNIYNDSFIKIPIGNTELFAEEICKILDSPETIEQYQKKGLECSKKYDWDIIADEDWKRINNN